MTKQAFQEQLYINTKETWIENGMVEEGGVVSSYLANKSN